LTRDWELAGQLWSNKRRAFAKSDGEGFGLIGFNLRKPVVRTEMSQTGFSLKFGFAAADQAGHIGAPTDFGAIDKRVLGAPKSVGAIAFTDQ
jgi:hypothetical protein